MSIERVRDYLKAFNRSDDIIEFETSSATVALAALALGCEEAKIAKSLAFDLDGKCTIVVVAGDAKIDNRKYKDKFLAKAKMLSIEETAVKTAHAVGGVCPFALNDGVAVYLDISLKRFDYVYPAAGSSNSAIKLSCDELERFSDNFVSWVDVCKGWQEN